MKLSKIEVTALASQIIKEAKKEHAKRIKKPINEEAKKLAEQDWQLVAKLSSTLRDDWFSNLTFEKLINLHNEVLNEDYEDEIKFKNVRDIENEIIILALSCDTTDKIISKIRAIED